MCKLTGSDGGEAARHQETCGLQNVADVLLQIGLGIHLLPVELLNGGDQVLAAPAAASAAASAAVVAALSAAADAAAVSAAVAAAVSAAAEAVRAAAVQEGDKLFSDFCRINFII